jgi:hypothetical protein
MLRPRLGAYDPPAIEEEIASVQADIDDAAFDLYGFSEGDRVAALGGPNVASFRSVDQGQTTEDGEEERNGVASHIAEGDPAEDDVEEEAAAPVDHVAGLLSWAFGVAFGRFDLRLATGEREAPREPDPFDSLPAKSPGMLPDGKTPFHAHPGILVDDPGHPHDLARLIEDVLARAGFPAPEDVRYWLQRDFFPFHLQRYSKSRRKAPIYWPLSTVSGSYTLWVYYPGLTSQTLYTAINDFLEPKLTDLGRQSAALRAKGDARTGDEMKALEALQGLEGVLVELRDALLRIAPTYQPNHDDGVQITAAPLWPLFRHKPWQKLLKKTWDELGKGDYDWAHLAMTYWSARVRKKCEADRSLAIAHGLEDLYQPPDAPKGTTRGRKRNSRATEGP